MDNCCYYRPFDDQTQDRVRLEADAILAILDRCGTRSWILRGSDVVEFELSRTQDETKRENAQNLYSATTEAFRTTPELKERADALQELGIKTMDSFHRAIAENGNVDIYLTTDDILIKKAQGANLNIKVSNPVNWLMEVTGNE
jgi:hypothetical protein